MEKIWKRIHTIIPEYSMIPLIFAVVFNLAVYGGSRMIAGEWTHHNIEGNLDRLIPFWPPTVAIYLGCYLFWIVNYILIGRQEKKEVCRFFAADFLSRVVCLVCYLAYPTTNTRPAVDPEGFWNQLVIFLYSIDAADNLFPSIHCLVSWFCYIGLRGKKNIPLWYRAASCLMALLVCISTLTTKQHVIPDVIGGIFLAELCFLVAANKKVRGTYERILNKINGKLLSKGGSGEC